MKIIRPAGTRPSPRRPASLAAPAFIAAAVAFSTGCAVRLTTPDDAVIRCTRDADCPGAMLCQPGSTTDDGRCVRATTNSLPTVDFGELAPAGAPRPLADVTIPFILVDADQDECTVTLEYSADGTTWWPSTLAGAGPASDHLQADADGVAHEIWWDALADAGAAGSPLTVTLLDTDADGVGDTQGVTSATSIAFRMVASDGKSEGPPARSGPIQLGDKPPAVTTTVPPGVQTGLVVVDYTLTDLEADRCSLLVELSVDGGAFTPATVRLTSSRHVVGTVPDVPASATGTEDILTWDSASDLPAAFRGDVELRLTPHDGYAWGAPATTGAFTIKNNTPPVATLAADLAASVHAGRIPVEVRVADASSDPTQLALTYSIDGGGTWVPAVVTSQTAGLPSSPSGEVSTLLWDSTSGLGGLDLSGVRLRIVPSDYDEGESVETDVGFRVDNRPPSIVSYTHRDTDANGDIDRVEVLFDEPIAAGSLVSPVGFVTDGGVAATGWTLLAANGDLKIDLTFSGLSGTAPMPVDYDANVGGLADLRGNPVPTTAARDATTVDAAPPLLIAAVARETPPLRTGIDAGDRVLLLFSEPLLAATVDAANVDTIFGLSDGHSFVDSGGGIGGATWASTQRLEIVLTTGGTRPTLKVGDAVTVSPGELFTPGGETVANSAVLGGTFSPAGFDFDGDGVGDFAAGSDGGVACIMFGLRAPGSIVDWPAVDLRVIAGGTPISFARSMGLGRDLNADGFSDLLVGSHGEPYGIPGYVHVYLGHTRSGTPPYPDLTPSNANIIFTGHAVNDGFGRSVTGTGDFNGDGLFDLLVGAPAAGGTGAAYVFFGRTTWPATLSADDADVTLMGGATGDRFGESAAFTGDTNGDGYDDLVVGAPNNGGQRGAAYLFLGSASPATVLAVTNAATVFTAAGPSDRLAQDVSQVGDFNGDGLADFAIGSQFVLRDSPFCNGAAYILLGTTTPVATRTPADADLVLQCNAAWPKFGQMVATAGDVNADGYSDLLVSVESHSSDNGAVWLFLGSAASLATSPDDADWVLLGSDAGDGFGSAIAPAGDLNDDGFDDFLVGAKTNSDIGAPATRTGGVYVFLGAPGLPLVTGSSTDAVVTVRGGGSQQLGFSLPR